MLSNYVSKLYNLMKVFKTIESDITRSGQALSIFGKEARNVYRDFQLAEFWAINYLSKIFKH